MSNERHDTIERLDIALERIAVEKAARTGRVDVALNPVRAKLSKTAADWPWSSTPAHFRREDDGLVTVSPLLDRVENLAEFPAMEPDTELEAALMKGQSIGRPLMSDQELLALEQRLGRRIRSCKRGRAASTEP